MLMLKIMKSEVRDYDEARIMIMITIIEIDNYYDEEKRVQQNVNQRH
jgi:hypothetical protein